AAYFEKVNAASPSRRRTRSREFFSNQRVDQARLADVRATQKRNLRQPRRREVLLIGSGQDESGQNAHATPLASSHLNTQPVSHGREMRLRTVSWFRRSAPGSGRRYSPRGRLFSTSTSSIGWARCHNFRPPAITIPMTTLMPKKSR